MDFWNHFKTGVASGSKKALPVMGLTTLFSIACSIQISASVYSQKTRLSLDVNNQSIKEVLYQIERQSDFRFIYESGKVNLDRKVSLHVEEQTVETILRNLFKQESIQYEITENNFILINPARKSGGTSAGQAASQQRKQ